MRVLTRFALIFVLLCCSAAAFANHFIGDCPVTLVAQTPPPAREFERSPHGVFRSGSQVFVLRGQTLTTFNVTDLGDLQIAREDFIGTMGARDVDGAAVFNNGFLFVSGEAGLEVFDLRNVRAGGSAPQFVSRTPGLHYRRMAISGNTLVGLYPATDLPCAVRGDAYCHNVIDILNVSNLAGIVRASSISSLNSGLYIGFNDVAFNHGFLIAGSVNGTFVFNVTNPSTPTSVTAIASPAEYLVSNGTNLLGIGNEKTVEVWTVSTLGGLTQFAIYSISALTIDRANEIEFHRQGFFDEANGRLIMLIDEIDPLTDKPARTIAINVFDFSVPMWEGSDPRGYESISYTTIDEVKHNPVAVGANIYVVGERTGVQTYGACGQVTGRVEWDGTNGLACGGADIHGWVTGDQRIANVELFLDGTSLGTATIGGTRTDISSRTPVNTWRIRVNLDNTSRGEHVLRAVGTDALGNRRQFASNRIFFAGPGQNCVTRRRTSIIGR